MFSHKSWLFTVLLVVTAIPPAHAFAQGAKCQPEDTIADCFTKKYTAGFPNNVKAQTAGKPAGEANAGNLMPTINDYLPKLATALLAPGLDSTLAVRLVTNQSLDHPTFNYAPWSVRLGADLTRPKVFAAILDSLPEARRGAVRDRLAGELTEIDDIELIFGINAENRYRGRRYESHLGELSRVLATSASGDKSGEAALQLISQLDNTKLRQAQGCPTEITEEIQLGCLTDAARSATEEAISRLATASIGYSTAYAEWTARSGWKSLPDLLNNQPQFSLEGSYRPRPRQRADAFSAVGPERWSIRGRWERGWANLNEVRNSCSRRDMDADGPGTQAGYTTSSGFDTLCFSQYVNSPDFQQRLKRGARAFLQAELGRENHYVAPFLETDSAHFQLPSLWLFSVSAGFGEYLGTGSDIQSTRVDFAAEMQWAQKEDPLRPARRGIVSLTLTQRLNQNFSLLSGVGWSPNGEFNDRDIQRVRFNLGVRYKLVPAIKSDSGT